MGTLESREFRALKKVNYSYKPFLQSQISARATPHTEVRVVCGPGRPNNTMQHPGNPQGAPTPAQTLKRARATPPPAPWRPQAARRRPTNGRTGPSKLLLASPARPHSQHTSCPPICARHTARWRLSRGAGGAVGWAVAWAHAVHASGGLGGACKWAGEAGAGRTPGPGRAGDGRNRREDVRVAQPLALQV